MLAYDAKPRLLGFGWAKTFDAPLVSCGVLKDYLCLVPFLNRLGWFTP
jgi:hypothetical protein